MRENLNTEYVNVTSYELNEASTIYVEKSFDKFVLEFEGESINLDETYTIDGLAIKQEEIEITLENENQLLYFKTILEEIKNGNN